MILSKKLDRFVGALALAGVGVAAQSASAAVVFVPNANINIPSTFAGVYLNVVTGANATAPAGAPGWDVNPWNSTSFSLFSPTAPAGGAYVNVGGNSNLAPNAPIGPGSTFAAGAGGTSAWSLGNSNNLVGFRFQNEANGNQIHYGWMRVALSSTLQGQPRTIVEYAYESTAGVAIGAGVPTPGAASLLGLAGLAGLRRRR
ncbi:MAG: hypothetical protein ACKVZJ_00465 [Phycisphaerales bacterium]